MKLREQILPGVWCSSLQVSGVFAITSSQTDITLLNYHTSSSRFQTFVAAAMLLVGKAELECGWDGLSLPHLKKNNIQIASENVLEDDLFLRYGFWQGLSQVKFHCCSCTRSCRYLCPLHNAFAYGALSNLSLTPPWHSRPEAWTCNRLRCESQDFDVMLWNVFNNWMHRLQELIWIYVDSW